MKKVVGTTIQIILDLIVGLAVYFCCTELLKLEGNISVIVTLAFTAIFAEFFEVKSK